VEQLSNDSGVPLKNTSAQLQQLLAANLVSFRKVGTKAYYRVADHRVSEFLELFERFAELQLAELRDAIHRHLGDPEVLQAITADELRNRMDDQSTIVIDVRSQQEFEQGHVPGAVSVPAERLLDRLAGLPRGKEIVAYCGGPYCIVSPQAVTVLRDNGYNARILDGGFARWHRTGHRTVNG
ncbi:ArsR/SmtB family transcription factor, partial [Nocardia gipuzkoensis]